MIKSSVAYKAIGSLKVQKKSLAEKRHRPTVLSVLSPQENKASEFYEKLERKNLTIITGARQKRLNSQTPLLCAKKYYTECTGYETMSYSRFFKAEEEGA